MEKAHNTTTPKVQSNMTTTKWKKRQKQKRKETNKKKLQPTDVYIFVVFFVQPFNEFCRVWRSNDKKIIRILLDTDFFKFVYDVFV